MIIRYNTPNGAQQMAEGASYRKVYETLRAEILDGKYSAGKSFPSSTVLSRRFGITRFTIRQALDILAREGLVKSQRGRGTFVTKMGTSRKIGLMLSGLTYSEYFQPDAKIVKLKFTIPTLAASPATIMYGYIDNLKIEDISAAPF